MEGKINLITYRQAKMSSESINHWQDSIVILNQKRFKVKAEFIKKNKNGVYLDLSDSIYRTSNFIIVDEEIYHRNDYIDSGILEIVPSENGLIVYFLIPLTKEDFFEIPVINEYCYLDGSFQFLGDIIVEVPVGIVVNLDNPILDLETVSWEFNFLQSTTMLEPYVFVPHATNHLKGVVTFNQPGPWEIIYHADGCRLVLELNV